MFELPIRQEKTLSEQNEKQNKKNIRIISGISLEHGIEKTQTMNV